MEIIISFESEVFFILLPDHHSLTSTSEHALQLIILIRMLPNQLYRLL